MNKNGSQFTLLFALLVIALSVVVGFAFLFLVMFPLIRAWTSGSPIRALDIMGMRLRGNPVRLIVDAQLALLHSGTEVPITEVERTYMVHRSEVRDMKDLVRFVRDEKGKPGVADDLA